MRMLAIECATEACSLALFEEASGTWRLLEARHEILGRGHAEQLVPLVASLPDKGRAQDIRVSLGPGSFTGVRIGLAAARALGLAWNARVIGYPTLALVATMARLRHPGPVGVCMAGGHGEWFVQDFGANGLPEGDMRSVAPDALTGRSHSTLAGNRAREKAALSGAGRNVLDMLPDARFVRDLPEALFTAGLTPIYGREPDARLPA